jgi:molybdate transport system substrate-binding protein
MATLALNRLFHQLLTIAVVVLGISDSMADEIRVAVASNFAHTIKTISERFETDTGHKLVLSFGSTGKHYTQISNGAPFDVFFAADDVRPELLEEDGVALPGSRFTYAVGKLVLWSSRPDYVDSGGEVLMHGEFRHLSIANPKFAPYGRAAREVLQARGLWGDLPGRVVRGENVAQAFQFVESGNAELGFVALSQVVRSDQTIGGSFWEVPQALYAPIEQQAVLLRDSDAARALLMFVRSDEVLKIIRDHGYGTS